MVDETHVGISGKLTVAQAAQLLRAMRVHRASGGRRVLGVLTGAFVAIAACGAPGPSASPSTGPPDTLRWSFEDGTYDGFGVDISDFQPDTRGGLEHAVVSMPAPLSGGGIRVEADNRSDDLWHFLWRELGPTEGIAPNATYDAVITLRVASAVPSGCMGVGGGPDAVTLKGGVGTIQPAAVPKSEEGEGYIGFSIDKGSQTVIGPGAVGLGTIGTSGTDCGGENPWEVLERSGTMSAASTADGRLWVYVGGDSGFEASTTLIYDEIELELRPG